MRPLEKLAALSPSAYSSLVEAGAGGVLGGAGGYAVDKQRGSDGPGKATAVGALGGALTGGVAGKLLRERKLDRAVDEARNLWDRRVQEIGRDLHNNPALDNTTYEARLDALKSMDREVDSKLRDRSLVGPELFAPFGIGMTGDRVLSKVAASPLTVLTEVGTGAALGGLGGYATEKKDEKGKRSIGARTGLGALGGGALGSFGGALGRLYKVNPNKASAEVLSKGDRAKFRDSLSPENRAVLDQAETGYHPFGIGLKKAPPDLGPNWKRSPPEADGEKAASIAQYSVLFDKIDSGEFGPHVKEALFGVCEGLSSSLQSHHAKVASSPMQMTESQARQARLDQLLRKF